MNEAKTLTAPAPSSAIPSTVPSKWIYIALALTIAIHLVPVWWFKFLPTQDGPAHLENALTLRDYATNPLFREHYVRNPDLDPNLTGHLILANLMRFIAARTAGKLLVSLYVIAMPLSLIYALRAIRAGGEWVALLLMPFVFSLALHKGLYNFCLSLPLFFILLGYAIRHTARLTILTGVGLLLLSLVLYFTHLVSLVMAYWTLPLLGVWLGIARRFKRLQQSRNPLLMSAILLAPAMAMALRFVLRSHGEAGADRKPMGIQLLRFFELDALASFRRTEVLVGIGLSALLWLGAITLCVMKFRRRSWNRWDGLLLLVAGAIMIYLIAPNSAAGGGQLNFRLSLYPYFLLLLWISVQQVPKIVAGAMAAGGVIAAMLLLALHWTEYKNINVMLSDFVTVAPHVAPGSTISSIDASRQTRQRGKLGRVWPMWHAVAYVAAEKQAINFSNYEAAMGYFPICFRQPELRVQPADSVEAEGLAAATSGAQYLVLWEPSPKAEALEPWRVRLLERYDLDYQSPHGWTTLYRRKSSGAR